MILLSLSKSYFFLLFFSFFLPPCSYTFLCMYSSMNSLRHSSALSFKYYFDSILILSILHKRLSCLWVHNKCCALCVVKWEELPMHNVRIWDGAWWDLFWVRLQKYYKTLFSIIVRSLDTSTIHHWPDANFWFIQWQVAASLRESHYKTPMLKVNYDRLCQLAVSAACEMFVYHPDVGLKIARFCYASYNWDCTL